MDDDSTDRARISRILVALDGSARAPGVFEVAATFAEQFHARLHIVRAVWLPPEFPAAGAGSPIDRLPDYATQEATRELAAIAKAAGPAVRVEPPRVIVTREPPWRVILSTAGDLDVDLVVLGSHGYHGVDRILGTTAGRVANHATCNVLVVHDRSAVEREGRISRARGRTSQGSKAPR
jgi:nucleotide-binding universal stress UspA family protein